MARPNLDPKPPAAAAWDIAITRLAQVLRPRLESCAVDLCRRFQAIGIGSEMRVGQTPRGLSIFLAVVGRHGLICIVDMTLVDGMAMNHGPCAVLDIRLLDACGDVVVQSSSNRIPCGAGCETAAGLALVPAYLERAATAAYTAAVKHFELPGI